MPKEWSEKLVGADCPKRKSAFGNHGLRGFYGLSMSYEKAKFHLLGENEWIFKFSILSAKSVQFR